MPGKLIRVPKRVWLWMLIGLLLTFSAVTHSINMFHFPYYENDEGVYMSQAWSLLTQRQLAPYTYWYDHAPAGWILIAIWVKLSGGFFTFGHSVNSGRVLMMILHVCSAGLLFYIGKKLTHKLFPGVIALLIFSLSPLAIYYQRRVLLDNIMIFWILLSIALLLKDKLKLSHVIVSAVCFGVAVLTKENAVFFGPAIIYLLWLKAHHHHKSFALIKWLAVSGLIVCIYFLYALLKKELLPVSSTVEPHSVSLIDTLQQQFNRGRGLPFWHTESDFYLSLIEWLHKDFWTTVLGIGATLLVVILAIRHKLLRVPALLSLFFWIFLIRGKTVINFYIMPLMPILALDIGIIFSMFSDRLAKMKISGLRAFFQVISCLLIIVALASGSSLHFHKDETTPQLKAIAWIKENVTPETKLVIDDYGYVDLHAERYPGDRTYPHADWFWKIQSDPAVRDEKYHNDWRNIDYIVLSHEMLKQTSQDNTHNLFDIAYAYSDPVIQWTETSSSYLDLSNSISTNGDWMAVFRVRDERDIALENSWHFYKHHFIHSYGQVIDPQTNYTTSEGQSYALLRAVWMNDKTTFDGVWAWTKDHLQYRNEDKLFSWLWLNEDGGRLVDNATAADADQDIALALVFAYRRWQDPKYLEAAQVLINDIWRQEVVSINNRYYLLAGSGAHRGTQFLINPSYLSPASYRIFARVDSDHDWEQLAEDSYYVLNQINEQFDTVLPPNWVVVTGEGNVVSASGLVGNPNSDDYGFDAFRTYWRIALDAEWFDNRDALAYLSHANPFFRDQVTASRVPAIYNLDGQPLVEYEALSTFAAPLTVFSVTNKQLADEFFETKINPFFNFENGYWGDQSNYYDQNWVWFGLALHIGKLPEIW